MTFIRPDSKARAPLARSLMIGAGGPRGPRPMSQASNWDAIKAAIFLSTYLLRKAISAGTQRPSAVALRRHQQWHSEVISSGTQRPSAVALRGHQQWHSDAISSGTQRPSEVIRGHPRSSEVIRDHPRSSEVICSLLLEHLPKLRLVARIVLRDLGCLLHRRAPLQSYLIEGLINGE